MINVRRKKKHIVPEGTHYSKRGMMIDFISNYVSDGKFSFENTKVQGHDFVNIIKWGKVSAYWAENKFMFCIFP